MEKNREFEAGQTLLIVVLVMIVALTIGLSVASRTITSLRTTEDDQNSQQALSAAEAGIEQEINKPTCVGGACSPASGSFSDGTQYNVEITVQTGTEFLMKNNQTVRQNIGGDIWLVEHGANGLADLSTPWNGVLTIYWGSGPSCETAALEVTVVRDPTNPQINRYAYDPCTTRQGSNKFEAVSTDEQTVSGVSFSYHKTITVSQGVFVRVTPLYNDTKIGFSAPNLPSQGKIYRSTGTSSDTKRKVVVYEEWPTLPIEFFQYAYVSNKFNQ